MLLLRAVFEFTLKTEEDRKAESVEPVVAMQEQMPAVSSKLSNVSVILVKRGICKPAEIDCMIDERLRRNFFDGCS